MHLCVVTGPCGWLDGGYRRHCCGCGRVSGELLMLTDRKSWTLRWRWWWWLCCWVHSSSYYKVRRGNTRRSTNTKLSRWPSHHVCLVLVGLVFECRCGQGISSSSHPSRPDLGTTRLVVDYPTPSPRLIMGNVVLLLFLCVCSGMLLGDLYLFFNSCSLLFSHISIPIF